MNKSIIICITTLLIITGCGDSKQSSTQNNGLITVDVTASYPEKEIILQDYMDVEYIPLETADEFVCQGVVLDIGNNHIVVKNNINDGDIFIFDRNGKALKKFNRKGQGPEEYNDIIWVTIDEDNGEIFLNDQNKKRIAVYDLEGNFKRSLPFKEESIYSEIYNFDRGNLICYDENDYIHLGQSFLIISKEDGNITKDIQIPFKEKKSTTTVSKNEASGFSFVAKLSWALHLAPHFNNWILPELSSDTIYSYSPDHIIKPLIVRTPPIQSMEAEVFLFLNFLTDSYYFMRTIEMTKNNKATDLLYDKQQKTIFNYTMYNGDYSSEKEASSRRIRLINNGILPRLSLNADKLVEDYEKGLLKGKLKEIAATLDDDSNPVIMVIKHKLTK